MTLSSTQHSYKTHFNLKVSWRLPKALYYTYLTYLTDLIKVFQIVLDGKLSCSRYINTTGTRIMSGVMLWSQNNRKIYLYFSLNILMKYPHILRSQISPQKLLKSWDKVLWWSWVSSGGGGMQANTDTVRNS